MFDTFSTSGLLHIHKMYITLSYNAMQTSYFIVKFITLYICQNVFDTLLKISSLETIKAFHFKKFSLFLLASVSRQEKFKSFSL